MTRHFIASPQTCPPSPPKKKKEQVLAAFNFNLAAFNLDHPAETPSTGSPSAAVMPPMEQSPLIKATVTPPLPTVPQAEDDFFRDEAHLVGASWHNTRTLAGYSYGI